MLIHTNTFIVNDWDIFHEIVKRYEISFLGGTKTNWEETYFIPVCCFILFNFGDYIGKEIATRIQYPKPTKRGQIMLLLFSIMRIVFIPLFILCNASPSNRSTEVNPILIYILFLPAIPQHISFAK